MPHECHTWELQECLLGRPVKEVPFGPPYPKNKSSVSYDAVLLCASIYFYLCSMGVWTFQKKKTFLSLNLLYAFT